MYGPKPDGLKQSFKLIAAIWIVGLVFTTAHAMSGHFDVAIANLRTVVDIFGVVAIILGVALAGRTLWRKYTASRTIPAAAPRPLPRVETTVIGRDMPMLIRFAATSAADAIAEQKDAFEQENQRESSFDHALRFATDDFVVGYAVGIATRYVLINGRQSHEIPMEDLLTELQSRLSANYPSLDFESTYRGGSYRMNSGIFFGLWERGARKALRRVLNAMSPHALGPEIDIRQYAHECGGTSSDADLVQVACVEMRTRYGS